MKLTLSICILLFSAFSFAATITSTGSGDWESDTSWDLGRVPTDGDEIIIASTNTITVTTNNSTCNGTPATHIYISGTLTFTNGAKLNLGCGSSITVETGGSITGGSGGGNSKKILICGTEVWNSGDPDVGPGGGFGTPLPIDLLSFEAFNNEQLVELVWVTASEKNNDKFEILRSSNGFTYETIAEIDGAGTTSESRAYQTTDNSPIGGTSYYMLKQTDYDGAYEEFGPVAVNRMTEIDGQCVLTIYPNPCPGNCRAKLSECPGGSTEMRLMMTDATGHIVNETYVVRKFDGSFDVQIDKSNNLKPGVYIISASTEEDRYVKQMIAK